MKQDIALRDGQARERGFQTGPELADKRQHPRLPVSFEVEIVDTKTQVSITGRATDFGVGGCYVDSMTTFPKDTAVEAFLHWEERTLRLQALVSYSVNDGGMGMGLAFTRISVEEGANLMDWVMGLGGVLPERAPAPMRQTGEGDTRKPARTQRLESALDELVALLVRKQVLSETEGLEIRECMIGPGYENHR